MNSEKVSSTKNMKQFLELVDSYGSEEILAKFLENGLFLFLT
jgi:hypothetical protein